MAKKSLTFLSFYLLAIIVNAQVCINHQKISALEGGFSGNINDISLMGYKMDNLGDLDGDGVNDVVVGSLLDSDGGTFYGSAFIFFMNIDGTVKAEQKISATEGGVTEPFVDLFRFGAGVTNVGDVDGDGITDIAIGITGLEDGGNDRGGVLILFLNTDGTVKAEQKISQTTGGWLGNVTNSSNHGNAVEGIGDFDGDGIPDLIMGGLGDDGGNGRGGIFLFLLNADGTVRAEQKISDTQGGLTATLDDDDLFGAYGIANLGDMDGDGITDIAVGNRGDDDGASGNGAIFILFLNADGTVKAEQKISATTGGLTANIGGSAGFGTAVESLGDIDGDGIVDIAVGAEYSDIGGSNKGAIYFLFLNADGTVKAEAELNSIAGGFTGDIDDDDLFGRSINFLGDVDGDGYFNLMIGADQDDDGGVNKGAIHLIDFRFDDNYELELQSVCPDAITNTITTASATSCINGVMTPLMNDVFDLTGSSYSGIEIDVVQWQSSTDGVTWIDIIGATNLDFTMPLELNQDTRFRRVYTHCCGTTSVSNEVQITVMNESPTVLANPLFYCPGAGQTDEMALTVTGGTPPYTYNWGPAAGLNNTNTINPTVTFGSSDTYFVTVTGSDGCEAVATAVMIPIQADAGGTTTQLCTSTGVQIGMNPIPAVTGVTYSWLPTTDLSCSDCPNPIANPGSNTVYTLTINDGNGCTNNDQTTVIPNVYEADAGLDRYVCRGDMATLGTPTQTGFTYGWAPGIFIDDQTIAQPTFVSGVIPSPNPFPYTLTTYDTGSNACLSTDEVLTHVAFADAGPEQAHTICNTPYQIGTPDCCGGQARYEWTIVSGDANSFYDPITQTFSNTADIPMPYVLPTTNGSCTEYQVTVYWGPNPDNTGGAVCTDTRSICVSCGTGGCPAIDVTFDNDIGCGGGTVGTVMGVPLLEEYWNLSWTPTTNLSCTNCNDPVLTANITSTTTYTLNYTNIADPSISCAFNVDVFPSTTAAPVATAQSGYTCSGVGVNIGAAAVAGWSYAWSPATGLDNATISNPLATPTVTTNYTLVVTDDVTGCSNDTLITVAIFDLSGVTGGNQTVCRNETTVIGSPAEVGLTYSWSPAAGLNNTALAQPTATVAANATYTVTVTAPNGCNFVESVTLTAVDNFAVVTDNLEVCFGQPGFINAEVVGVAPQNLLYTWAPAAGLNSTSVASPMVIGATANTSYNVTVTSLSGGCIGMGSASVTVDPLPSVTLPDVNLCTGPVAIGTPSLASHSYSWTPTEGLSDPLTSNPTADVSVNTTYTLTIRDNNGCSDQFTQNVVVQGPQIVAGPDVTTCAGAVLSVGATPAQAGITYTWSPTTYLENPNAAQTTARPESTITYTLSASDGVCTTQDQVTVTVTPSSLIGLPNLSPFMIGCESECQIIGIANNPSLNYQWIPASAVQQPTSSMTQICPTSNQIVSLQITDSNTGCTFIQNTQVFLETGNCPVICPPMQCLPIQISKN